MNDIRGNTPAILNEQSGTLRKPFLVKVVPGKNGNGHIFIIKIGNLYYEMERNYAGKKWIAMRCKRHGKRGVNGVMG